MALVGYSRVSSHSQSLRIQRKQLEAYGCEEYFEEKYTGTTADRPALKECRKYLRKGDVLVITKLDRLCRSTFHLTQIADELEQKGVDLVVLDQNIDTTTPTGRLLYQILAVISEFENSIRKERVSAGVRAAQERGVKFGRKPKLTNDQITEMREKRAGGVLIKDLMQDYGLSKASVYRLLKDAA
jgi:DNA invertase Pin-like site-specific DNA recombinase